jgi:hypothetical protein
MVLQAAALQEWVAAAANLWPAGMGDFRFRAAGFPLRTLASHFCTLQHWVRKCVAANERGCWGGVNLNWCCIRWSSTTRLGEAR